MSTNKKKRIVVIGGVAAGTSAASKAKRIDPSADVKIVQESVLEEILGVDGQVNGIKTNTKPEINSNFVDLGTCLGTS